MASVPPPSHEILSLVSALSSPENHALHVQAIQARDHALSGSDETFGNLCLQLAFLLIASDHEPSEQIFSMLKPEDLQAWQQTDPTSVQKLHQQPAQWVLFGQMAGLILKNSLIRPPMLQNNPNKQASILDNASEQLKECLIRATLDCQHAELRAVASSILSTCAVSTDGVQPALHATAWPQLIPRLLQPLSTAGSHPNAVAGALATLRKLLEDNPSEMGEENLENVVTVLLQLLNNPSLDETSQANVLQSLQSCLLEGDDLASPLVLHMDGYVQSLLKATNAHHSKIVRQWACRSIATLLELRGHVLAPHFPAVAQAMLERTSDPAPTVGLDACEFWLTFCTLDDENLGQMTETVQALLPQLIPVLLNNMVYGQEEQGELMANNALELENANNNNDALKPIFHKSKAQKASVDDGSEHSDDGDDDDDEFGDNGAWTLRKCAAASLDSLANIYGSEFILPVLLPALEQGLSNQSQWVQEACILALGAVAEGCHLELSEPQYLGQLHPYLLNSLSTVTNLPQLQSSAAWTLGRYAGWAIEQVQTGAAGHLLATMTKVFLDVLVQTRHTQVQVACASAFGVLVEAAGDLMAPYLEPIYQQLVICVGNFYPSKVRSLLMLFDVFGIMADCCGPAIAEGNLPVIYMPTLLQTWDTIASHDQRTLLLPLMEALSSIAVTSGPNYQPFAMRSFDNAMCIIEMTTLSVASMDGSNALESEEEYDPIVCATDLLDGMVEGLGVSFIGLVSSSPRYGPHFLSVLHTLCKHDIAGVRMSALALLGDLARNAPALLEPALPELLKEAVSSTDPAQQSPSVCTNAVWAVGEICVRCVGNPQLVEPIAPTLIQNLLGVLVDHVVPGLAENAAACAGRLGKVHPQIVAADIDRLLLGWCDAMGKVADPTERRDAYEGFLRVIYVNPQGIQKAATTNHREVADIMVAIILSISTWHMPSEFEAPNGMMIQEVSPHGSNEPNFRPFPPTEAELGKNLHKFMQDMKTSIGLETWDLVQRSLPVKVRRLVREMYQA